MKTVTNGRVNVCHFSSDKLEVAKSEDLGKTASYIERRFGPLNATTAVVNTETLSSLRGYAKCSTNNNGTTTDINIGNNGSLQNDFSSANNLSGSLQVNNQSHNWKTITNPKKRRKQVEKKILAKEIPGNIGDRTVEELTNFIENKKPSVSEPIQQRPQVTNGVPKRGNSSTPHPAGQKKPSSSSINNATKRQPQKQAPINNGITNNKAPLNAEPSKTPPVPTRHNTPSSKQAPETNDQVVPRAATETPRQSSKLQKEKSTTAIDKTTAAVVFAEHIPLRDDDVLGRYTFGFFDEQPSQLLTRLANDATDINHQPKSNHNSDGIIYENNVQQQPQKKVTQHNLDPNQAGTKNQPKSQVSPNSDVQRLYKFKDNIDTSSFNYDQILKFISSAWREAHSKASGTLEAH